MAREGKTIERKSRSVTIHQLELERFESPYMEMDVSCSKGTYIRSMAHDFGKKLQSGAYLAELRRTAIGDYRVEKAMKIKELEEHFQMFSK